jgi:flavin-dependent dehydrogenase
METADFQDYDVVIMGGAFSGASAALILKRDHPQARVLVVERNDQFDRKVGESTSEVAGCFLTRVLHLGSYLSANQYQKHGLRMWFCNDSNTAVNDCTELGPKFQSRLPTFQLDRSRLDEHVLKLAAEAGAELLRPATISEIELADGEGMHTMKVTSADKQMRYVRCKWLIDASGKAAVLAKKLGKHKPLGDEHPTSSVWCRFSNVNDVDSYKSRSMNPRLQDVRSSRASATNHLMGKGWWCWLIPLPGGDYSAGVVWDRTLYELPPGGSMAERLKSHLLSHPVGRLMFENAVAVEDDLHYYKGLAYHTEQAAGNRWFAVGDAAGFIDPLYSQGLDYCGFSVYMATDAIKAGLRGECTKERIATYAESYPRSYRYWFEALYKGKYLYMGDAELMRVAFALDLSTYFIGPVRLVYTTLHDEFSRFPYDGANGRLFAKFMKFYNRRLQALARKRLALGTYGISNTKHEYTFGQSLSPDLNSFKFLWMGLKHWARAEARTFWHGLTRKPVSMADSPTGKAVMAEGQPA